LELPNDFRAFDYDTITDVILHMRYTARNGGNSLKEKATSELQAVINSIASATAEVGLMRLFSIRHEFPTEWHRFLHPSNTETSPTVELALTKERFPFQFVGRTIRISAARLFLKLRVDIPYSDEGPLVFDLKNVTSGDVLGNEFMFAESPINNLAHA